MYSYAKSLLEQIDEAVENAWNERETELRAEFEKVKDAAVAEAHVALATGDGMTAQRLSNGQDVPTTVRAEVEEFLTKVGADVPDAPQVNHGTDPLAPSIVDPPLAANPANLVAGDGTDPVKTPPVVTPVQSNGVATVVAPAAPEGDKTLPAPPVPVDVTGAPTTAQPASAPSTPAASTAPAAADVPAPATTPTPGPTSAPAPASGSKPNPGSGTPAS